MGFIDKLLPPRDTEGSLTVAEGEEEDDETKVDDDLEEIDSPTRASRKVPTRASQTPIGKNKKPNIDEVLASYICAAQETLKAKANKSNTNTEDEDVSFFNSLLPSVRKLNQDEKFKFRMNIMSTLQSIITSKSGQVQSSHSPIPQYSYQTTQSPHPTSAYSSIPPSYSNYGYQSPYPHFSSSYTPFPQPPSENMAHPSAQSSSYPPSVHSQITSPHSNNSP